MSVRIEISLSTAPQGGTGVNHQEKYSVTINGSWAVRECAFQIPPDPNQSYHDIEDAQRYAVNWLLNYFARAQTSPSMVFGLQRVNIFDDGAGNRSVEADFRLMNNGANLNSGLTVKVTGTTSTVAALNGLAVGEAQRAFAQLRSDLLTQFPPRP